MTQRARILTARQTLMNFSERQKMMKTCRRIRINVLSVFLVLFQCGNGAAQTQHLRVSAYQRDFFIGAAVAMTPFRNESVYYETLRRDFNVIVAENAFKWDAVHPSRTTF